MGSLRKVMKSHKSEYTSRYVKILATLREADRNIEKWVSRLIDEIEENRDTQ